jgi:hypothetical protein
MRSVNRLRVMAPTYLLPLVLGALVLRALIPPGFMPGGASGITAMMCSPSVLLSEGATEAGRIEVLEIPGSAPPAHCDFCLAAWSGAALAWKMPGLSFAAPSEPVLAPLPAWPGQVPLRAQSPRGPPLA